MTRFDGAPPHETLGVGGIVGNQSARKLASVFTFHDDGIAALKTARLLFSHDGKETLAARSARSAPASMTTVPSAQSAGDPALLGLRRTNARHEQRVRDWAIARNGASRGRPR